MGTNFFSDLKKDYTFVVLIHVNFFLYLSRYIVTTIKKEEL
jgi:hypothetical protein